MAPLAYLIYLETALALVQVMCLSQLWSLHEVNKIDRWEKRQEIKWTFGTVQKCYRDNLGTDIRQNPCTPDLNSDKSHVYVP